MTPAQREALRQFVGVSHENEQGTVRPKLNVLFTYSRDNAPHLDDDETLTFRQLRTHLHEEFGLPQAQAQQVYESLQHSMEELRTATRNHLHLAIYRVVHKVLDDLDSATA